jgi:hypothetical protein
MTIQRECGGWLALSPESEPLHIAVEGPTEQEAVSSYETAGRAWAALLQKAKESRRGVDPAGS